MSINDTRRAVALATLRARGGPMAAREIVETTGIPLWALTGNGLGVLLLLEAEGAVTRTGAKRGTRWCAA